MASHRLLAAAVVVLASILHAAATATIAAGNYSAATKTAYDVLEQHNLPRGLLPEGEQSYVLRPDGSMEVTFPGECDFFITVSAGQRYKLRYVKMSMFGTAAAYSNDDEIIAAVAVLIQTPQKMPLGRFGPRPQDLQA
ncbi:hypothetical protein E2562_008547 [Oryza meyeriana var. granulata]|uniref:Uncharacterized protein n=1 Tax=Oryza meyeriana var. granulata TaxID=110450 RepID=A0A6G1C5F9_9ORYZ|nr:hypothetical protein E2562_008547 [Oryza meyeriana var. granulata]